MPIYEFSCNKCGERFEKLLSSSDISAVTCTTCKSSDIKKMISSGSFRLKTPGSSTASRAPAAPACGRSGFS